MRLSRCILVAVLSAVILSGCASFETGEKRSGAVLFRYAVEAEWPKKPEDFTWAQMPGMTVDPADQVYLFTRNKPAVQVYRTDGTFVRAWDIENAQGAHQIRIGPEGRVWTADHRYHVVRKYSTTGELLLTLGEYGRPGDDENHLNGPTDTAVLPAGDIFVSDGYGNRRIIQFDKSGRYVRQWGTEGTAPGQFALPHSVVADSRGRLYVADRENARIQVFDTRGTLLDVWADVITPWGLHLEKDRELWVCGSSPVRKEGSDEWLVTPPPDQVVLKLSLTGKVLMRAPLQATTTPPGTVGEVDWVHGIGLDSQGNLYLGDIQGRRAQKFSRVP